MKLDVVVDSWLSSSVSSSADVDCFVRWFKANKVCVIHDTMLKPIQEECGLGCPPDQFTTNANESLNAMIKSKMHYQRSELPKFIDKVKELVKNQQREIEKAVIRRGKYRLKEQYRFLEIPESKWFVMSEDQRKKHLSKLQSVSITSQVGLDSDHTTEVQVKPSTSAIIY